MYLVYSSGFSLLFSVAGLPNLAYGIFYTIAAYGVYIFLNSLKFNILLSAITSIILTIIIALAINEVAVKPVIKSPISMFISTLAAAYVIEEWLMINYGKSYLTLPRIQGAFYFLGVPIEYQWGLTVIVGIILMVLLYFLIYHSDLGLKIRAVAESWEEAWLIGINPSKILMTTTIISAIYAAIAAITLVPLKAISPDMGWSLLFTAFAIIVLAGVGEIKYLLASTLIYAFSEQTVVYIANQTIASIVPLLLVIIVLIIRPAGLFGGRSK